MSAEARRVKDRTEGEVIEWGDIKHLTSVVLRLQDRGPTAVFKNSEAQNPTHDRFTLPF